jgi:transcriptional regulator with XRE-family HTH domain
MIVVASAETSVNRTELVPPMLGTELREARKAAGLTQEELSAAARIHRTYVSLLERDLRSPTIKIFLRITRVLGVSAADLIRRVEDESI